MEDLYIVINEVEDGTFYGECPMIKGCNSRGASLCEVQNNILIKINKHIEDNTKSKFDEKVENVMKLKNSMSSIDIFNFSKLKNRITSIDIFNFRKFQNLINLKSNAKRAARYPKRKRSVVPKW